MSLTADIRFPSIKDTIPVKKILLALLISIAACTAIPAAKDKPTCFSPVEIEALDSKLSAIMQQAYEKGFKAGIAHEQSTI